MDSVNYQLPDADSADLLRDITRLYVRSQRRTVACCGPESTARCHVLGELARSGPLRLTELAARLDADKSWMSRTVAAMVAGGLLWRGGAKEDARVVQVEPTAAGRRVWRQMDAALRRHAEGALSMLSADERQVVDRGLALLRSVLEREGGGRRDRVDLPEKDARTSRPGRSRAGHRARRPA